MCRGVDTLVGGGQKLFDTRMAWGLKNVYLWPIKSPHIFLTLPNPYWEQLSSHMWEQCCIELLCWGEGTTVLTFKKLSQECQKLCFT